MKVAEDKTIISEAASEIHKRGRGRPTVTERYTDKAFPDWIKGTCPNRTTRTQATQFYCSTVFGLLSEAASEIPFLDSIFIEGNLHDGTRQKTEIVEQLGRMLTQDGYSESDVKYIAAIAAEAYHEGATVKQIKAYILKGRKTNQW